MVRRARRWILCVLLLTLGLTACGDASVVDEKLLEQCRQDLLELQSRPRWMLHADAEGTPAMSLREINQLLIMAVPLYQQEVTPPAGMEGKTYADIYYPLSAISEKLPYLAEFSEASLKQRGDTASFLCTYSDDLGWHIIVGHSEEEGQGMAVVDKENDIIMEYSSMHNVVIVQPNYSVSGSYPAFMTDEEWAAAQLARDEGDFSKAEALEGLIVEKVGDWTMIIAKKMKNEE